MEQWLRLDEALEAEQGIGHSDKRHCIPDLHGCKPLQGKCI
jgi:hypothetical protein